MAERLKAPVLKTGNGSNPFVGSNPTPTVERDIAAWSGLADSDAKGFDPKGSKGDDAVLTLGSGAYDHG